MTESGAGIDGFLQVNRGDELRIERQGTGGGSASRSASRLPSRSADDLALAQVLGRRVEHRGQVLLPRRLDPELADPRRPEVGDLHEVVGRDEDVLRLDVAVQEPALVGGGEPLGRLVGDPCTAGRIGIGSGSLPDLGREPLSNPTSQAADSDPQAADRDREALKSDREAARSGPQAPKSNREAARSGPQALKSDWEAARSGPLAPYRDREAPKSNREAARSGPLAPDRDREAPKSTREAAGSGPQAPVSEIGRLPESDRGGSEVRAPQAPDPGSGGSPIGSWEAARSGPLAPYRDRECCPKSTREAAGSGPQAPDQDSRGSQADSGRQRRVGSAGSRSGSRGSRADSGGSRVGSAGSRSGSEAPKSTRGSESGPAGSRSGSGGSQVDSGEQRGRARRLPIGIGRLPSRLVGRQRGRAQRLPIGIQRLPSRLGEAA